MFESAGAPVGATTAGVDDPLSDDPLGDDPLEDDPLADEPLDEAGLAELNRVARARLDRMFPRTGPARSEWRLRTSQRDAQARRRARKVITPHRRSAWEAALPRTGAARSASALPGIEPGPDLAAALADLDIPRLAEHDLVHVVAGTERLASWASACQAEAIGVLSNRELYDLDPPPGRRMRVVPAGVDRADPARVDAWQREVECVRAVAAEIGAALHLSRPSAEARVWTARALTRRHPATLAALRDGTIDGVKSRIIVDELDPDLTGLATRIARTIEDAVLHRAGPLTASRLRSLVRHERIRLAPSTAEAEHKKAKAGRRVEFVPADDGMGWVHAYLSADTIAAVRAALDAAADTLKTSDQAAARAHTEANPDSTDRPAVRTIDQCRADALGQMAWLALDTGHLGGCPDGTALANPRGHRPRVHVTIPATTLLGLDQHPGELTGYGPIPASLARAIAARGDWYRILTDPVSGTVLDVGTTKYAPPADLDQHVQTRDRACRGPGCRQPAHRCDLDHTIEHPNGPTAAHNLGPLCRNDHLNKHRRGWRLSQPRPGVFEWTSPAGHTYLIAPEQVGPLTGPPTDATDTNDASPSIGHDPPADPTGNPDPIADSPTARPGAWHGEDDIPPF